MRARLTLKEAIALDKIAGRRAKLALKEAIAVDKIEEGVIKDYEKKMAIVIPIKNEKLQLFEGVISGVPHECLIIVVSNSERKEADRFEMERDTLEQFCRFAQRQALIMHQKNPALALALAQAGYTDLLDEVGETVRDGKSEGMVIGLLMAMLARKEYVGFVDADNYFPGAVWEYVKCYAAGFSISRSPYAMVRILWRYKPKLSGQIYFKKWGRVSGTTNKCFNSLISAKTGFETDIIKTANAGEHAMSVRLAEILPFASGYAVEPQELVSLFEDFSGVLPTANQRAARDGIEIFQIESRNPHFHEERGTAHLREMLLQGLGTVYHSLLCDEETKRMIIRELLAQRALKRGEEPAKPNINRPPQKVNIKSFIDFMAERVDSYSALKG
ncbi:MAG: mannosyl-3-phosphoglycerate synthase [Chloroflexi bacterium]|nr:mannosyl-3-phosphoglycerate synthase [Chloroflexota bacterium]